MKINQISVFLENKQGRLFMLCDLLGKHNINIHALIIAESEGFGVARIIVDKPKVAVNVLKDEGLTVRLTDIVAVEVPDRPGGLSDLLKILSDTEINVEYMYGFGEKFSDRALMVFRFDDPDKATKLLHEHGIGIVRGKDIQEL
jgi:hypothetical protein